MARALKVLAALTLVTAVIAGCGDDDEAGGRSAAATAESPVNDEGTETVTGGEVDLDLNDSSFDPAFVDAPAGETITVRLENDSSVPHTFTIDEQSIDETVGVGESASVEVTLPDSGMLPFYCRFHQAQGMQGAFRVT